MQITIFTPHILTHKGHFIYSFNRIFSEFHLPTCCVAGDGESEV